MGLWAKSVIISTRFVNTASRASGASRIALAFPKAACIATSRPWIAAIATESSLWETEAGRAWLIRLMGATLLVFGLKRGWEPRHSASFGRLRLDAHVGCSPSALRTVMHRLERLLLGTAAAWEKDGIAHGEIRPVIGAVDETFLQRMMLVFMDLATGYC